MIMARRVFFFTLIDDEGRLSGHLRVSIGLCDDPSRAVRHALSHKVQHASENESILTDKVKDFSLRYEVVKTVHDFLQPVSR